MKSNTLIIFILLFFVHSGFCCTIFKISDQQAVFVGSNEDGIRSDAKVWFIPGNGDGFGRVYFGFSDNYAQGGLNEKGLFFDIAATPFQKCSRNPAKKHLEFNILTRIIEKCSTVKQALHLMEQYNLPLERAHIFIADQQGDSAIIEGDRIFRDTEGFQIATNFLLNHPEKGRFPCERTRLAEKIARSQPGASAKTCEKILSATHQEEKNPTQYSAVCNLNTLKVRLYYFHDFTRFFEIDLKKELKQKEHSYILSELVPPSFSAQQYQKKMNSTVSRILLQTIAEKDVQTALEKYRSIKYRRSLLLQELAKTGLHLIKEKKYSQAIEIIRLYVDEFPEYFGTYQFLGYAYSLSGQAGPAIANLQKALKLNPNSNFAKNLLEKLKNQD